MDVTLALQRAAQGFAPGTKALAAALDMSPTTLAHKVSPTYPGQWCSPEEAVQIMQLTDNIGPLVAMGDSVDCLVLRKPPPSADGNQCAMALSATVKEFGEFCIASSTALNAGQISGNKVAEMEREGMEAIAAIQELIALATRLNEAAKPAAERGAP